jgi:hypothetical protein
MITLLGSLLGFLSAAFPDFLKLFRDAQDRKHELKILEMQMEQQKLGASQRLEEIQVNADIAESQALYRTYNTGIRWVDALNGTVRPVIAYSFFILYACERRFGWHCSRSPLKPCHHAKYTAKPVLRIYLQRTGCASCSWHPLSVFWIAP